MPSTRKPRQRRSERYPLDAEVEFFIDSDVLDGRTANVSQTGLAIDADAPLPIALRITTRDGEQEERDAELVWARENEDGTVSYGLRFASDDPVPLETIEY